MPRRSSCVGLGLLLGCASARREGEPQGLERQPDHRAQSIAWADVRKEIEAHICMRTFEVEGRLPFEEPVYGPRSVCNLPPPTTALERAVEQAYVEAGPMLSAMRHEWVDGALASLSQPDAERRLAAARAAYLQPRFSNELLLQLGATMQNEGLGCAGCPPAQPPMRRTIAWSELEPYFAAYLWPDPVVTAASGEPKISMNICIGKNGIAEIASADPLLGELGFLTAFHTDVVRERGAEVLVELANDAHFKATTSDEERTRWLRKEIGRRVAAEPGVLREVCATIDRFRDSTGISVTECASSTKPDKTGV